MRKNASKMADSAERLKAQIAYLTKLIKTHKGDNGKGPDQHTLQKQGAEPVRTTGMAGTLAGTNARKSVYVLDRTKPTVSNSEPSFNAPTGGLSTPVRGTVSVAGPSTRIFTSSKTAHASKSSTNKYVYRRSQSAAPSTSSADKTQKPSTGLGVNANSQVTKLHKSTLFTSNTDSPSVVVADVARKPSQILSNVVSHKETIAGEKPVPGTTSSPVSTTRERSVPVTLGNLTSLPSQQYSKPSIPELAPFSTKQTNYNHKLSCGTISSEGNNPYVLAKGFTPLSSARSGNTFQGTQSVKTKALPSKSQLKWSKGVRLSKANLPAVSTGSVSDSELYCKGASNSRPSGLLSSNSYTSLKISTAQASVKHAETSKVESSYSWRKTDNSQQPKIGNKKWTSSNFQVSTSTRNKMLEKVQRNPKTSDVTKLKWSRTDQRKGTNLYQLVRGSKCPASTSQKQRIAAKSSTKKSKYKLVRSGAQSQTSVLGVWRPQNSLKLDRRKTSIPNLAPSKNLIHWRPVGSREGFIQRRKKVVLRKSLSSKSADIISRFNVVRTKRKAGPIQAQKSNKLVMIGGVAYKSSANKLAKASPKGASFRTAKQGSKRSASVNIRGQVFIKSSGGKTLTRVMKDVNRPTTSAAVKPGRRRHSGVKRVVIGGVTYVETSPGTLVRSQLSTVKKTASQIVQRSVEKARLSKLKAKHKSKSQQYCMFYNRFGKCNKGERCPFIHDPSKIAVCTKFLRGTCKNTDGSCPFSHKVDKDKMPVCQFFLRGTCVNDNCPYSHVNVNSKAVVCQDFIKGYCALGKLCKKKHVLQCEEFSRTGTCSLGRKCKLMHRKGSVSRRKRKLPASCENEVEDRRDVPPEKQARTSSEVDGFLQLVQDAGQDIEPTAKNSEISEDADQPAEIRPRFLKIKSTEIHPIPTVENEHILEA